MGLNENYGIVAKPSWVSQYHLSASPIPEEDTITRKKGICSHCGIPSHVAQ